MVKAIEWLDRKYNQKGVDRKKVEGVEFSDKDGKITIYEEVKNKKGKIVKQPKQVEDENKLLEGDLDLSDFINLRTLKIPKSKLDFLDLSKCTELESLIIYSEKPVINFDLSNNKKIKYLECDFSKLSEPKRTEYVRWFWENIRDKDNELIPGLEKLVDVSDLDNWVENYDWNKVGDVKYHKICGNKEQFTILNYKTLDSLGEKVFARKSNILYRLLNDREKMDDDRRKQHEKNEERTLELAEGYRLSPRTNEFMGGEWSMEEKQQEMVIKALLGDIELLKRLQGLSYLKTEFKFGEDFFVDEDSQSPLIVEGIDRQELKSKLAQLGEEIKRKKREELSKKIFSSTQEWLDEVYSDKKDIETIDFTNLETKGQEDAELVIDGYPKLKQIINKTNHANPFKKNSIIKVTISDCPELESVDIKSFLNNQRLVLDKLPKLSLLYCEKNKLAELEINSLLPKLKGVECNYNKLVNLDLSNCPKLVVVDCQGNLLQKIKFSSEGSKLIKKLDLRNNNFPEQDLSMFQNLTNLRHLYISNKEDLRIIGNNEERKNIYNRFIGSLEPLKNLSKLDYLDVSNTNIESGLEYLSPDAKIICNINKKYWSDCKVIKIYEELKPYEGDLKKWRENYEKYQIAKTS